MKVFCVFSLESPHPGDSNEYTQYTIFNIKRKPTKIISNLQLWEFFLGTQARVRNSHGVRAIEVLLYHVLSAFTVVNLHSLKVVHYRLVQTDNLFAYTRVNPLAKACGLSPRTGGQTMV